MLTERIAGAILIAIGVLIILFPWYLVAPVLLMLGYALLTGKLSFMRITDWFWKQFRFWTKGETK